MPFLQELYREWPFFRMLLSNMDMVLAKSSIAIASRYAELVPDVKLRESIFGRIRREWHLSIETLLDIMGHERLLQGNPLLDRSIRNRFPYLDPLNHVQVELLKEHRAQNPDEQVLRGSRSPSTGFRPDCGTVGKGSSFRRPGERRTHTRVMLSIRQGGRRHRLATKPCGYGFLCSQERQVCPQIGSQGKMSAERSSL